METQLTTSELSTMLPDNGQQKNNSSTVDRELDVLKILYEEKGRRLQFIAERSFKSTLQIITLNLLVLGGLIANKLTLSIEAKLLGSITITVFNAAMVLYIVIKGRGYIKEKSDFTTIEKALTEKSPSIIGRTYLNSSGGFWTGSGIFAGVIIISCICTVLALWIKLVATT